MQTHIIEKQTCDMGHGKGEYIFSNMTLEQVLDWFEQNLHDWGLDISKAQRIFNYKIKLCYNKRKKES